MDRTSALISATPTLIALAVAVLCMLDKTKIATRFGIISLLFHPIAITNIYKRLDAGTEISFSVISYAIIASLVLLAILTLPPWLSSPKRVNQHYKRWILFVLAIVSFFIGMGFALTFWYIPQVFGLEPPTPQHGVIGYLFFNIISAWLLYYSSRFNSIARPNLMRKINSILVSFFASVYTFTLSLILIFAFPIDPPVSFPLEGSYIFLANIIWGVMLFLMNKETLQIKR